MKGIAKFSSSCETLQYRIKPEIHLFRSNGIFLGWVINQLLHGVIPVPAKLEEMANKTGLIALLLAGLI